MKKYVVSNCLQDRRVVVTGKTVSGSIYGEYPVLAKFSSKNKAVSWAENKGGTYSVHKRGSNNLVAGRHF